MHLFDDFRQCPLLESNARVPFRAYRLLQRPSKLSFAGIGIREILYEVFTGLLVLALGDYDMCFPSVSPSVRCYSGYFLYKVRFGLAVGLPDAFSTPSTLLNT